MPPEIVSLYVYDAELDGAPEVFCECDACDACMSTCDCDTGDGCMCQAEG